MAAISPITSGLSSLSQMAARKAAEPSAADGFSDIISRTMAEVSAAEATADQIAVGIATGQDQNIQDLLIATSKATLGVQLLTQVRNRAVEAYQEIMRMQV
jgi:flagellar hook-basal body complex protein FliE